MGRKFWLLVITLVGMGMGEVNAIEQIHLKRRDVMADGAYLDFTAKVDTNPLPADWWIVKHQYHGADVTKLRLARRGDSNDMLFGQSHYRVSWSAQPGDRLRLGAFGFVGIADGGTVNVTFYVYKGITVNPATGVFTPIDLRALTPDFQCRLDPEYARLAPGGEHEYTDVELVYDGSDYDDLTLEGPDEIDKCISQAKAGPSKNITKYLVKMVFDGGQVVRQLDSKAAGQYYQYSLSPELDPPVPGVTASYVTGDAPAAGYIKVDTSGLTAADLASNGGAFYTTLRVSFSDGEVSHTAEKEIRISWDGASTYQHYDEELSEIFGGAILPLSNENFKLRKLYEDVPKMVVPDVVPSAQGGYTLRDISPEAVGAFVSAYEGIKDIKDVYESLGSTPLELLRDTYKDLGIDIATPQSVKDIQSDVTDFYMRYAVHYAEPYANRFFLDSLRSRANIAYATKEQAEYAFYPRILGVWTLIDTYRRLVEQAQGHKEGIRAQLLNLKNSSIAANACLPAGSEFRQALDRRVDQLLKYLDGITIPPIRYPGLRPQPPKATDGTPVRSAPRGIHYSLTPEEGEQILKGVDSGTVTMPKNPEYQPPPLPPGVTLPPSPTPQGAKRYLWNKMDFSSDALTTLSTPTSNTGEFLTLSTMKESDSGTYVRLGIDETGRVVEERVCTLYVTPDGSPPPAVRVAYEPVDVTVPTGQPTVLECAAASVLPVQVQWYHGGTAIQDATDFQLVLDATVPADAGQYYAEITDGYTTVTTRTATLTLTAPSGAAPVLTSPTEYIVSTQTDSSIPLAATNTPEWFFSRDMPPGLSLNPYTGKITGRLLLPGEYESHVEVYNRHRRTVATLTFRVEPPEIAVFNGISTTAADERESDTGLFGFLTTMVGTAGTKQTLTIQNTGRESLTGLRYVLKADEGNPRDFVVGPTPGGTVDPLTAATLTVTFKPTASGQRTAVLEIWSNDEDENPFLINLSGFATMPAVTARLASTAPLITAASYDATGRDLNLSLGFAPTVGAQLTVIKNTGRGFIQGVFNNLSQGQVVPLVFNGRVYPYVADYHGGTGNDLVLIWADTRLYGWGQGVSTDLSGSGAPDALQPVELQSLGALKGRLVVKTTSQSLALCADGTLVHWTQPTGSQPVPRVVSLAGSILEDTSVVAISSNVVLGENGIIATLNTGNYTFQNSTFTSPVEYDGEPDPVAIAAGEFFVMALNADGALWYGEYQGDGSLQFNWVDPAGTPLEGKSVVAISAGAFHWMALCSDGSIIGSGRNQEGQLGIGVVDSDPADRTELLQVLRGTGSALAGKTVVQIAAGALHSMALCSDGTLAVWGANYSAQLGNNDSTGASRPTPVTVNRTAGISALAGKTVTSISAGFFHSLALCSDGTLVSWGDNEYGELGNNDGTMTDRYAPVLVSRANLPVGARFSTIMGSPDQNHNLALVACLTPEIAVYEGGSVAGAQRQDATGSFVFPSSVTGTPVVKSFTIQNVGTGPLTGLSLRVSSDGGADFTAGALGSTTLAAGASTTFSVTFRPVMAGVRGALLEITSNDADENPFHLALTGTGTGGNAVAATFSSAATVPVTADGFVAEGRTVTLQLTHAPQTGAALTVVKNTSQGFITGTFTNLAQGQYVTLVFNGTSYRFIADYYGGTGNDLVLRWAGTSVYLWGQNDNTQLGDDTDRFNANLLNDVPYVLTTPPNSEFYTGMAGKPLAAVAAGGTHSLALTTDGSVFAWGSNSVGQTGTQGGNFELNPARVQRAGVMRSKQVVSISAGDGHCLALCSDGTVLAWGADNVGQLGDDNATQNRDEPVAVFAGAGSALYGKKVISIAAGLGTSFAVCTDGTVAAWGNNAEGELGDGTTENRAIPVAVSRAGASALSARKVVALSAGAAHTLALCSDGQLAVWGNNTNGELGTGTTTASLIPTLVNRSTSSALNGRTVTAIAAGGTHSLVLCSDGSLVTWGMNDKGQLGTGAVTAFKSLPTLVTRSGASAMNGRTASVITAGNNFSAVLCTDNSVVTWGDNAVGSLGEGSQTFLRSALPVRAVSLPAGLRYITLASNSTAGHVLAPVAAPQAALGTTYVVTTAADNGNNTSPTVGSLRWAIKSANGTPGSAPTVDTIAFNIPPTGSPQVRISPVAPLPDITGPVTIDGFTQPGAAFDSHPFFEQFTIYLSVEINGSLAGAQANGLVLNCPSTVGSCVIRGLAITGFKGDFDANKVSFGNGIAVVSDGHRIERNLLGVRGPSAGVVADGCTNNGVTIHNASNTLIRQNVISANFGAVNIQDLTAFGNIIEENFIGTGDYGDVALPNYGLNGAIRLSRVACNIIRNNLISGNSNRGVGLANDSCLNVVQGNVIGLTLKGDAILPNGFFVDEGGQADPKPGIELNNNSADNLITGNVISANGAGGIVLRGRPERNVVTGNRIGTDITGTLRSYLKDNGPHTLPTLVRYGNVGGGIILRSDGIVGGNRIGGMAPGESNLIAHNQGPGVLFEENGGAYVNRTPVLGNIIHDNDEPGIDLQPNGRTANDANDADDGPNGLQNYPLLVAAKSGVGVIEMQGTLDSQADSTYRIEFFSSYESGGSAGPRAATYVGAKTVTTDANGDCAFRASLAWTGGSYFTATATNVATGDTSEFSPEFNTALGAPDITVESSTGGLILSGAFTEDYGNVVTGVTSVRWFSVKNDGSQPLTGISVTRDGVNAANYTINANGLPSVLAPGESARFSVAFKPGTLQAASYAATLHINSNDGDEAPFHIALTGRATSLDQVVLEQPVLTELVDDVSVVNFPLTRPGTTSSLTFTVRYKGAPGSGYTFSGVTLTGDNPNEFDPGNAGAGSPLVKAGSFYTFTVKFTPGGVGERTAVMSFANPTATGSTFSVTLKGVGSDVPAITSAPASRILQVGDTTSLSVGATGLGLTYQWLKNNVAISGATASTYVISPVATSHAGRYTVRVTNNAGSVTSDSAVLAVMGQPSAPQTVVQGASTSMTLAIGAPVTTPATVMSYRWRHNGVELQDGPNPKGGTGTISGTGTTKLVLTGTLAANAGDYTCDVTMDSPLDTGAPRTQQSQPFVLRVIQKPVMNPLAMSTWIVGGTVTERASATNSPTSYSVSTLPPGVTFNTSTGQFGGKPTKAGGYTLTLKATNVAGSSDAIIVPITVDPLPAESVGTFNGLVARTQGNEFFFVDVGQLSTGLGGSLNVTTDNMGGLSGRLVMETKSYPFNGKMDAVVGGVPSARITINRGTLLQPFIIAVSFSPTDGKLEGTVSSGNTNLAVEGWRNPWVVSTNPALNHPATALAGTYTAAFGPADPAHDLAPIYPQGYAHGTLTISKSGIASWAGYLADGTYVTMSSTMGPYGDIPFFVTAYTPTVNATAGSVWGWLWAQPDTTTVPPATPLPPTLGGELDWFKNPQTANTRYYKNGIPLMALDVTGALYVKPASGPILSFPDVAPGSYNAKFTYEEMGIDGESRTQLFRVDSANRITMPTGNDNPDAVTITTFNTSTGAIAGTFTLVDDDPTDTVPPIARISRKVNWSGILIPEMNVGYGQFQLPQLPQNDTPPATTSTTSPIQSGLIILEPWP